MSPAIAEFRSSTKDRDSLPAGVWWRGRHTRRKWKYITINCRADEDGESELAQGCEGEIVWSVEIDGEVGDTALSMVEFSTSSRGG